jgi:glutathionylspermidine synthase
MQRFLATPRNNWKEKVEAIGFNYHSLDGLYWDESAYYSFSLKEIEQIEKATQTIYNLCLEAVQHVIDHKLYNEFRIPSFIIPYLEKSWENDAPALYARMDLCVKDGKIKLLEFNADTPTSLFEAAIVQWYWLQELHQHKDQFNSLHEKLVAYWKHLKDYLHPALLHFTCTEDSLEDFTNTQYLRDCAVQAGFNTDFLYINAIGFDSNMNQFVDENDQPIKNIFKLYPWEWLLEDEFGQDISTDKGQCNWIEPCWKIILSNKALLPLLWKLFPNHENLLAAYDMANGMTNYVKKPIFSREGANITLVKNGLLLSASEGEYGKEGFIFQELFELPNFNGNYPVIGSWIIGQEPAGIGIRESNNLITNNTSRFIPHVIEG